MEENTENPDYVPSGVKKSRFLKKERKIELSYKENVESPKEVVVAPPRRRRKETKELPPLLEKEVVVKEAVKEKNRHGVTVVNFPNDPDDLDPIPRPPIKNVPQVCLDYIMTIPSPSSLSTTAGPTRTTRTLGSWRPTPRPCTRPTRASTTRPSRRGWSAPSFTRLPETKKVCSHTRTKQAYLTMSSVQLFTFTVCVPLLCSCN